MMIDMKEEIAKYQAIFDHKLALDRENMTGKREKLKLLNDQLLTQILALQNTQGPPSLPDRPIDTDIQDGKYTQSRRHCR